MDPTQHRYFFTKIMSTAPLLNGFVPFFACRVNDLSVVVTPNATFVYSG